jgi:hypothetical protein
LKGRAERRTPGASGSMAIHSWLVSRPEWRADEPGHDALRRGYRVAAPGPAWPRLATAPIRVPRSARFRGAGSVVVMCCGCRAPRGNSLRRPRIMSDGKIL